MDDNIKKRFLTNTDQTGRFIVKSIVTGITYYVEPIGTTHNAGWGDMDPATKKLTGTYGDKYAGCIEKEDSLITKENGFKNIQLLSEGVSPLSVINERDKEYERKLLHKNKKVFN